MNLIFDIKSYVINDGPGVDGRLWVGGYTLNYILDTSGDDELNHYLLSTKDLIDDHNPMGINDLYLGNVDVYAVNYEPPPYKVYAHHYVVHWYFKKVYVGHSGN